MSFIASMMVAFIHGEDVGDVGADDAKSAWAKRCTQAVGDCVGTEQRLQAAGLEGAKGIVGPFGLGADDLDTGMQRGGGDGGAGKQPAATYRSGDGVQVGDPLQQFQSRRALAGDDMIIVVGMHHRGPRALLDGIHHVLPCCQGGFAQMDLAAKARRRLDLGLGCVVWHHDEGRDA